MSVQFRIINQIPEVIHHYQIFDDKLFLLKGSINESYLSFTPIDKGDEISFKDFSAYDFIMAEKHIIFTTIHGDKSYAVDRFSGDVEQLPYVLHIKGHQHAGEYLCYGEYNENEYFLKISLKTLSLQNKYPIDIGFGNVKYWKGGVFISTKGRNGVVGCFDMNSNDIWQIHLSDMCAYGDDEETIKAELSNIYTDSQNIYALAGLSVVCIAVDSGEIQWHAKLDTAQSRGLVHSGFIYTTSGGYLNKINCKSGEIIYQVSFDYIMKSGRQDIGPISQLVWYDDGLWTIMDANPSYLIKFNPSDGSYQEVIALPELGITSDCHMPKFHNDRMYILDHNNTLHIFEQV
ncbi:MAG: hypothetical protein ABJH98_12525 [Reichenbachiella sp.]|uniref:hypothetical protein n=1 Tax=Reichenbachiella sp. TaxID=2184521 RepID=UPI003296D4B9